MRLVDVYDVLRMIPPRKPSALAQAGRNWSLHHMRRLTPAWAREVHRGDRVIMRPAVRRRLGIEQKAGTVLQAQRGCDGVFRLRVLVDGESIKDARWWHAAWFERVPAMNRIPAAEAYRMAA